MRIAFEIMGLKLELEVYGLRYAYIKTNWFDASWNRDERFYRPDGGYRHWCFDWLKRAA